MTELNDHLKLLFARTAELYCQCCGSAVRKDTVASIRADLRHRAALLGDPRVLICFEIKVPKNFKDAEVVALLENKATPESMLGEKIRSRSYRIVFVSLSLTMRDSRILGKRLAARSRENCDSCAGGNRSACSSRNLALFQHAALRALRHRLSGAVPERFLIQ